MEGTAMTITHFKADIVVMLGKVKFLGSDMWALLNFTITLNH
jgi:hypothetical protein